MIYFVAFQIAFPATIIIIGMVESFFKLGRITWKWLTTIEEKRPQFIHKKSDTKLATVSIPVPVKETVQDISQ